jgi:hypothetical protein
MKVSLGAPIAMQAVGDNDVVSCSVRRLRSGCSQEWRQRPYVPRPTALDGGRRL